MNNHRVSSGLLVLTLLLGIIMGLSVSRRVYGQFPVPVPGASVEASGPEGYGYATGDSLGFYNITGFLDTGNYSVTASAMGYVDTTIANVSVAAGIETTNVDVLMPVSGGISGTVTDAVSADPVPSAYVSAVYETDGVEYGSMGFTDMNGDYEILTNLATGSYNVTVMYATGHLMKTITGVSVTAGVMTNNVDIPLNRSAVISGTVTDSVSAATLEDIAVYAVDSNGDYVAFASTNASGMYVMNTDIGTGTYNITVLFPEDYLPNTVSGVAITAGGEYTVDMALDPSGAISGRITNAANGQPISGVFVSASSNGFGGYDSTNNTGHYRISGGLASGNYTVTAVYDFAFNMTMGVMVTQGSETTGVDMELTVAPSGTITGRVTDAMGDPIEYASVDAVGLGGFGSALTDENGDYTIDTGLGTGTYNVTATAMGYVSQELTGVDVTVGMVTADVDFELTVAPSGRISGQVLGEGDVIPEFANPLSMLVVFVVVGLAIAAGKARASKLRSSRPE